MKIVSRILSLTVLAFLAGFYISCGPDPVEKDSQMDTQIEKLTETWVYSSATFNGSAPDLDHSGMTLTITGSAGNSVLQFTLDGRPTGPSAWPASGTFQFGDTNVTTILQRNDGITVEYTVTDNTLEMDFDFDLEEPYNARGKSVEGAWHFEFTKQ